VYEQDDRFDVVAYTLSDATEDLELPGWSSQTKVLNFSHERASAKTPMRREKKPDTEKETSET
jgi:hypothetical protein